MVEGDIQFWEYFSVDSSGMCTGSCLNLLVSYEKTVSYYIYFTYELIIYLYHLFVSWQYLFVWSVNMEQIGHEWVLL